MWNYIDPVFIEEEKKRKNVEEERPQIELPLREPLPYNEEDEEDCAPPRGVYIIEVY